MSKLYRHTQQATKPAGLVVCLLLLAYALLLSSAVRKSATVDEQTHWQRGVAYLKEDATQFLMGNPVAGHAFASLMILTEPALQLPVDDPAWAEGNWSLAGDRFLWQLNDNPQRIVFLGRLVTIWLTLLLGALIYRWGRDWAGPGVGLLALTLLLFDPNILAHGRLATNDLIVTFFMSLTLWLYWRHGRTGRSRYLWLTGLALGLAACMKFNGLLLVPMLGLLAASRAWRGQSLHPLVELGAIGLLSWLTIWALYGFELRPLPGGAWWDDLFWQLDYLGGDQGVYLAGQVASGGWWYYFPFAFLVKTPLTSLLLLLAALLLPLWPRFRARSGSLQVLWLPVLVYLGLTLFNALNIGFRYLLPLLPWLFLFMALRLRPLLAEVWGRRGLIALVGWLPLLALWLWPDYLPFFNGAVGGPAGGWTLLSDSNVDWGQDLPALAAWQAEDGRELLLSYFGTAAPSAYGLRFQPLPTWPPTPEQLPPARQPYAPADPAPGLYAISVTHLHGAVLGTARDIYAYFRARTPLARSGGSIFIYEVAAQGEPFGLALGGLTPAELPTALLSPQGNNNRQVRWFEPGQAVLVPESGVAISRTALPELLAPWLNIRREGTLHVAEAGWPALPLQATFGGQLALNGFTLQDTPDGSRQLLTIWQVAATSQQPLKLFLHEVDAAGNIVAQWDGLGVDPLTWRPGDQLLQIMTLPPAGSGGSEWRLGVYDSRTGQRLPPDSFAGLDYLPLTEALMVGPATTEGQP